MEVHDILQEAVIKTFPKKKKCKKEKWLSGEASQIAEKRREAKTEDKKKEKKRPQADCGSNHEPLIAKFRLK